MTPKPKARKVKPRTLKVWVGLHGSTVIAGTLSFDRDAAQHRASSYGVPIKVVRATLVIPARK